MDTFAQYGYLGVFAALMASGFGFPIPEELPILTAGGLVGHADTLAPGETLLNPQRLRWWIMVPVCILGVVVGDGALYGIGRVWGPRILANAWVRRRVPPDKQAAIEKNFHDRGIMILLTARLTPGIRTPIFLMAGVLRVPMGRFLLADGLYAIPGVNIMFWLSYFLFDQVMEAYHAAERYRAIAMIGVLSAVIGVVLYRILTNRKAVTGSSADVPLYNKPVEMVTEVTEMAMEKALKKTIDAVTNRGGAEKPPEAAP